MKTTGGRLRAWMVLLALAALWLGIGRPWTVLPIERERPAEFDATAYVDSIWESRVLPAIDVNAVDVAFFRDAVAGDSAIRAGAVGVDGVVLSVDTSSRAGVVMLDVDPLDGEAEATVQVGPVLRGTALRDALDFIQFSDFSNQIEFAAVATALNGRVAADVLGAVDFGNLVGRRVRIVGATAPDRTVASGLLPIVPVRFIVETMP